MEELYRINIEAAYKPWRNSYTILTKNKNAFFYVKENDESMLSDLRPPDDDWNGPDEDEGIYEWLYKLGEGVTGITPYVLLDECSVYTE